MNKYQKEIELTKLSHEQKAFQELKKTYTQALADTKAMVKKLQEDVSILESSNLGDKSILQSRIYQLNYQKAMEEQLTSICNVVNSKNVTNIQTFLTKMYQDSYLGVNYNLQKSGIPVLMAANPSLIVKSINTPTNKLKFSETLYKRTEELKKAYKEEISRGIATGKGYKEIAKQLDQKTKIGFNNAYRIARTEGGRVSSEASMTAMRDAKAKGADIVKQWLATLDMRTRDVHGRLDGQIREIDEDFEIDGYKAQCPHGFGYPEMDINCRCAVLSVPRWDVEDSYVRYDDKHKTLIESKNYEDWKKGYYRVIEERPEVTKVILEAEKRIKSYSGGVVKLLRDEENGMLYYKVEESDWEKRLEEMRDGKTYTSYMGGVKKLPDGYELKSYKDVANFLENDGVGVDELNLMYADLDLLIENAVQLHKLQEKYPLLNSSGLSSLSFRDLGSGKVAGVTPASNDMFFSDRLFQDYDMFKFFVNNKNGNWTALVKEENLILQTVTHEYGHLVIQDIVGDEELIGGSRSRDEIILDTIAEIQKNAKAKDPNVSFEVSEYAQSNPDEYFAELYSRALLGTPNALDEALLEYLEKRWSKWS